MITIKKYNGMIVTALKNIKDQVRVYTRILQSKAQNAKLLLNCGFFLVLFPNSAKFIAFTGNHIMTCLVDQFEIWPRVFLQMNTN